LRDIGVGPDTGSQSRARCGGKAPRLQHRHDPRGNVEKRRGRCSVCCTEQRPEGSRCSPATRVKSNCETWLYPVSPDPMGTVRTRGQGKHAKRAAFSRVYTLSLERVLA